MSNYNVPNHFTMVGKNLNDMELEIESRDKEELMKAAQGQVQLREKFQQMKGKDEKQIVKDALEKTAATGPAKDRQSSLYFRVIKNRSEVYDIITRSFSRKKRWNELPHGLDLRNSWNLIWTWSKMNADITKLLVWQRTNHFIGAKNYSRKDFLKVNIERARKVSTKSNQTFNIMPHTFILPKEYVDFLTVFSELEDKEGKLNYWILKPAAKSRGRGIELINAMEQVVYGEPMIIQRYLKNPFLLNGYKFDMRIYVLVTSVNPLEAFIYKEGFGRFGTQPFSLDPNDKANKYIHLTNVSINKYNMENYDCDGKDKVFGGSKVSLGTLRKTFIEDLQIDWDLKIWEQVKQVCVKALVAAQNDIAHNPCCFDLYGFDVIIDEDLKSWLLEINSSPSLSCETMLDDLVKQRLIDDTIDLVQPIDFDRGRLFEVLERRVHEDFSKGQYTPSAGGKKQMNKDLTYILNGAMPRGWGEMPKYMGNYERLAPSPDSDALIKMIGGQKMFGSSTKVSDKVLEKMGGKPVVGLGSMPSLAIKPPTENSRKNNQ